MTLLRFLLVVPPFVFALLGLLPQSSMLLWQMKLGAIEYGHWFALFPLLAIVAGRRRSAVDSALVLLALATVLILLSTAVRAAIFATTARAQMRAVFPTTDAAVKGKPFSFARLWSLGGPPPAEAEVRTFAEQRVPPLALDFYPAEGRADAPCVVVVHGGGWDSGTRREMRGLNHFLAQRGYAVAAIDYRLSSVAPWPAQREDVRAALEYLAEHAAELRLNPKKFVLLGRSAGAQIAGAVVAAGQAPGVVGGILLSPPADLHFAAQYARPDDILGSKRLIEQYLGGSPSNRAANYDSASVPHLVHARTPPLLLLHGAKDDLVWVRQSDRLAAKLQEHGVRHVFLRPPWATHAMDYGWNTPGAQLVQWAAESFLAGVTGG